MTVYANPMPLVRVVKERLNHPVVAGLAVAAVATGAYMIARALMRPRSSELPASTPPPRISAAPFAEIPGRLVWPVVTNNKRIREVAYVDVYGSTHGNSARRFGASRDGRRHAGIDLYGNNGDPVVAIADGVVVATQTFHLGSDAILVQHGDVVVLYGEVEHNSWKAFGVGKGSTVRQGEPIARIACMVHSGGDCTSHMLHLETYRAGTTRNEQWNDTQPPPELLDPTLMLLFAAS